MNWEQKGFAVVSECRNEESMLPMVHAFALTEWQAKAEEGRAAQLPERLRAGLRIVPATLTFDMSS